MPVSVTLTTIILEILIMRISDAVRTEQSLPAKGLWLNLAANLTAFPFASRRVSGPQLAQCW